MDMGSVAQLAYFTFRQEMKKTQKRHKSPGMQRMTRKLSTGGGEGGGRAGQTSSSE